MIIENIVLCFLIILPLIFVFNGISRNLYFFVSVLLLLLIFIYLFLSTNYFLLIYFFSLLFIFFGFLLGLLSNRLYPYIFSLVFLVLTITFLYLKQIEISNILGAIVFLFLTLGILKDILNDNLS
jgi:hypothetical protein